MIDLQKKVCLTLSYNKILWIVINNLKFELIEILYMVQITDKNIGEAVL